MSTDKPDFSELESDLAGMAEPVAPPPQLKADIMGAIQSGEYPQIAPGESGARIVHSGREVSGARSARRSFGRDFGRGFDRDSGRGFHRGFGRVAVAAAAVVVLIAGIGIVGSTSGLWGASGDGSQVTQDAELHRDGASQGGAGDDGAGKGGAADGSRDGGQGAGRDGAGQPPMQGAEAEDHMHSIMAMGDVRSVSLKADGSTLDVVVSAEMDSGGAMVNGAPALKNGMGAQVWSINKAGVARSAGVIGQDPHDNVWMPLPADTMAVKVTEEPLDGSHAPSGTVLAEDRL